MKSILVSPVSRIAGRIILPGDKSIAHRAIILSAITPAKTKIKNFPLNEDCLSTVKAFRRLGIKIPDNFKNIKDRPVALTVYGAGLNGLKKPSSDIFIGDSGTSLRVILGILAGQNFKTRLRAGKSLSLRPMSRVIIPLRMMGAKITAKRKSFEEYAPITIRGGNLKAIRYTMPVASAQVKSALLLAGLYAKGQTVITERLKTRDHTERMLKLFKAEINIKKNVVSLKGGKELVSPRGIYIPGDISSASFFIVSALITKKSKILLKRVSLNYSRLGILRVLKRMKAKIRLSYIKGKVPGFEPMGDILVESSGLKGTVVKKEEIPFLIDELPILMVAACFAEGKSIFRGVGELRVKETDRIASMTENLRKMGADIQVNKRAGLEEVIIKGGGALKGCKARSFGDHRTAMSMVIAGLASLNTTEVDDVSCINKSFPQFLTLLRNITRAN